jgi:hypothetical protein
MAKEKAKLTSKWDLENGVSFHRYKVLAHHLGFPVDVRVIYQVFHFGQA